VIDTSGGLADKSLDPHLWTNPRSVMEVARNTYEALLAADPENADGYKKNYASFLEELKRWDEKFLNLFEGEENLSFLVYHPFLGYFAKDYGLIQYAVEHEGKSPKPREVANIINIVKEKKISVFLTVRTHSQEPAIFIADQCGLKPVSVDILSYDWDAMMTEIYNAFRR
jgi:zinc transport system substrate-binding protein